MAIIKVIMFFGEREMNGAPHITSVTLRRFGSFPADLKPVIINQHDLIIYTSCPYRKYLLLPEGINVNFHC